jgi:hypothetical protein
MRDTIEMAREAGDDWDSTLSTDKEFLKRLVALARADERSIEREACAKEADKWSKRDDDVGAFIGKAIRARGTSPQTGENT